MNKNVSIENSFLNLILKGELEKQQKILFMGSVDTTHCNHVYHCIIQTQTNAYFKAARIYVQFTYADNTYINVLLRSNIHNVRNV